MTQLKSLKSPLAITIGCIIASCSLAEDSSSARKGAAAMMLEEIQVTARKRSAAESAQDVPIAITALGADQIDAMYVKDLTDLNFTMPSVQTDQSGTFPGVQNFTIRGQGINSSIPSVDPTVGVFVDGVFLGVTYGVVMDMFDVESVEMLRGPQGLLFGRNVTGGAVVLRTARPDGEFGFKARTRVSSGLEKNIAMSLEGGLSDNLAGKLTLYYNDDDGYWKNVTDTSTTDALYSGAIDFGATDSRARSNPASGDDVGKRITKFARGTLVWDVNDDLALTFITENGRMDGDGAVWTNREDFNSGALDSDETSQDEEGFTDMDWQQYTLEANWDVGSGVITNILGYREINAASRTDVDSQSTPLFNVPGTTKQNQFSNELRYAFSTDDGKWDVTTGVYYFNQNIDYKEERWVGLGLALGGPIPIVNTVNLGGEMDHKTWGAFASADYRITDDVTLTAGLRYTNEEKEAKVVNADPDAGGVACVDPDLASCSFDDLSDEWRNWTPKLGVNWQVSDDVMLYASYTKGFRSGGVNFRNALPSLIDPGPTDEEEQDAFEIGFKSELMDGRLRLNGALYHVQIADMQRELNVSFSELPDPVFTSGVMVWQATVNAGDVDITGAELEAIALVSDNFSINASLGYVDSEYKRYSDVVKDAEALVGITLVGDDLPRLAPWMASLGLTYDWDLGDAGLITLRGSYSYRDPAAFTDSNTKVFESKRMANASIQWTSPDQEWVISAFGKNLNDEVQWGSLNLGQDAGGAGKGRVYGVEATYTY